MEQNSGGGPTISFFRKFMFPIVLGLAVIILLIIAVTNNKDSEENNEQTNDQATEESSNQNQAQNQNTNGQQNGNSQSATTGNVSATGTLRASDNATRGNYLVDSASGKIYIVTKRDFGSLLDKPVTLQAEGTLNQFTFLGFAESVGTVAGTDTEAMGGGDTLPESSFSFDGQLEISDDSVKGNYLITSGKTKVYLKSVRDYSSYVNSAVTLSGLGTLNSFTNATVVKK